MRFSFLLLLEVGIIVKRHCLRMANEKKIISAAEVAKHKTEEDCWISIHGKVYDVTKFLDDHPGGPEIITDVAGEDSTEEFEDTGHSEDAREQLKDYYVGELEGYVAPAPGTKAAASSGSSALPLLAFLALVAVIGYFLMQSEEGSEL